MSFDGTSVKRFLKGIEHTPLLIDQERALLQKVTQGDAEAREKLVGANQRFIVRMALTFRNQGISVGDLIQEGNLGLMEAIDRYDPAKCCRLISYAAWWIRLYMQRAIEQRSRTVTIPINKVCTLKKIRNFEYNFVKSRGRKPSYDEIAEAVKMPVDKVEYIYHLGTSTVSIHAEDEEGQSMEDRLTKDDSGHLRDRLWQDELRHKMKKAFKQLSKKERDVLCCRFGIGNREENDPDPASLRKAGRQLGLSAEGVRQIQAQAIDKLKDPEFCHELKSFA